jgi:hypothetical protein
MFKMNEEIEVRVQKVVNGFIVTHDFKKPTAEEKDYDWETERYVLLTKEEVIQKVISIISNIA